MRENHKLTIRKALAHLAATHALAVVQMEQMIELLSKALEDEAFDMKAISNVGTERSEEGPFANHSTLSIEWRGKSCFLGNTLLFRFFDRIAQTPNRYVTHIDLLEDVWGGEREAATIRGVAKLYSDN